VVERIGLQFDFHESLPKHVQQEMSIKSMITSCNYEKTKGNAYGETLKKPINGELIRKLAGVEDWSIGLCKVISGKTWKFRQKLVLFFQQPTEVCLLFIGNVDFRLASFLATLQKLDLWATDLGNPCKHN
jgi:hypothetical protein